MKNDGGVEPDVAVRPTPVADAGRPDGPVEECFVRRAVAERKGVNLYLLIDASPTVFFAPLWDKLLLGISLFMDDPSHAGIGVGFGYYGNSCNPDDYSIPKVPIAPLPGVAAAIKKAFPAPLNGKAAGAALAGAISYARTVQRSDPDRETAVVFMTDGLIDLLCGSGTTGVADRAGLGVLGDPPLKTYVVGLGAGPTLPDLFNLVDLAPLDDIAQAGGTTFANRIYVSAEADKEIASGLDVAADRATPCAYRVPDGMVQTRLNLEWADGLTAAPQVWPIVDGEAACGSASAGYWSATDSGYVELCPSACSKVRERSDGIMRVREECAPSSVPTQ